MSESITLVEVLIVFITNLNSTILNIKEGDGLLNYLANNPDLVQEVDSTMKNVHIASERLNEKLRGFKNIISFLMKDISRKKKRRQKNSKPSFINLIHKKIRPLAGSFIRSKYTIRKQIKDAHSSFHLL